LIKKDIVFFYQSILILKAMLLILRSIIEEQINDIRLKINESHDPRLLEQIYELEQKKAMIDKPFDFSHLKKQYDQKEQEAQRTRDQEAQRAREQETQRAREAKIKQEIRRAKEIKRQRDIRREQETRSYREAQRVREEKETQEQIQMAKLLSERTEALAKEQKKLTKELRLEKIRQQQRQHQQHSKQEPWQPPSSESETEPEIVILVTECWMCNPNKCTCRNNKYLYYKKYLKYKTKYLSLK
jgi:hypothetical protein